MILWTRNKEMMLPRGFRQNVSSALIKSDSNQSHDYKHFAESENRNLMNTLVTDTFLDKNKIELHPHLNFGMELLELEDVDEFVYRRVQ